MCCFMSKTVVHWCISMSTSFPLKSLTKTNLGVHDVDSVACDAVKTRIQIILRERVSVYFSIQLFYLMITKCCVMIIIKFYNRASVFFLEYKDCIGEGLLNCWIFRVKYCLKIKRNNILRSRSWRLSKHE